MQKLLPILTISYLLLAISCSAVIAAEPGLNLINQPGTEGYIGDNQVKKWAVITPENPESLKNYESITAQNVVIRLHAWWSQTGKDMLGSSSEQQTVATAWCSAINSYPKSTIYLEPFNELEQDYERASPAGSLNLSTAITRAKSFINSLQSCLTKGEIISPALDPQNVNFPTTSSAFANFSIISCHPYSFTGLDKCQGLNKPLLLTEIGALDKSSGKAVYNDCRFIEFFAGEGFIKKIQESPNVLAYFLFSFQPDGGSWKLINSSVVSALQGVISNLTCNVSQYILNLVRSLQARNFLPPTRPLLARGIVPGPLTTTARGLIDSLNPLWWVKYFFPDHSHEFPFHYKDTDQYTENGLDKLGDIKDMVKIIEPPAEVINYIKSIENGATHTGYLGQHAQDVTGYTSKTYTEFLADLGPGFQNSLYYPVYNTNNKEEAKTYFRDYYNFKSGTLNRALPFKTFDNENADRYLCRLAASSIPGSPGFDKNLARLFDEVIGYLGPALEKDFNEKLPNGIVDRLKTETSLDSIPVRTSDFLCSNKNFELTYEKCAGFGYPITPAVCSRTPDWKKTEGYEVIYAIFWNKFRYLAAVNNNTSTKIFLERCQQQDEENCGKGGLFSSRLTIDTDFGGQPVDKRTSIINEGGEYNKKASICYSCKVTVIYVPNFTKANDVTDTVNSNLTPYSSRPISPQYPQVVHYSQDDSKASLKNEDPLSPLAAENTSKQFNAFRDFVEGAASFLTRGIEHEPCQVDYKTITKEDGSEESVPTSTCNYQIKSALQTIIYAPKDFWAFFQNGQNLYTHVLPFKDVQAIPEAIYQATDKQSTEFFTTFQNEYNSGNGLLDENVDQMYKNGHDTAGRQSVGEEADQQLLAPDPQIYKTAADNYLIPYAWQQTGSFNF